MWITQWLSSRSVDEATGVRNVGEVSHQRLYRGAAPSADAIVALAHVTGIRTIVDLRDEVSASAAAGYALLADRAGITRLAMPISDREPPPANFAARFLALTADAALWPVFVHCAGGRHRTGLACAIYRMEVDRWSTAFAYEEARRYGLYASLGHEAIKAAIFAYTPTWEHQNR